MNFFFLLFQILMTMNVIDGLKKKKKTHNSRMFTYYFVMGDILFYKCHLVKFVVQL